MLQPRGSSQRHALVAASIAIIKHVERMSRRQPRADISELRDSQSKKGA
jgi:hypothetical protein